MKSIKSLRKNKIIIWLSGAIIIGCSGNRECINYRTYNFPQESPILYIESEDSSCIYNIHYDCYIDGEFISSKGKMYFNGRAFFVQLYESKTSFFKLFDITLSEGDDYEVEILLENGKGQLQMHLEKIVNNSEKQVYIFRATDNFNYDDHLLDVVYFVNCDTGIIGSYFSYYYEGMEQVLEVRGDILRDKLDYSNAEFRKLN